MISSHKDKPLMIRDEVHGDMAFDYLLRHVIDHECFQRLRYIKQLGLAEYVFPCANHSRFQHSLGAAYLAGQTFLSMLKNWLATPFRFEGESAGTRFFSQRTFDCVYAVAEHGESHDFWWQAASLAGLLHDVGHGPWSHTFEQLNLAQDFDSITSQIDGSIGTYFKSLKAAGKPLKHEDISVLYIHQIFSDLGRQGVIADWRRHFLTVSFLVNRKMAAGQFKKAMEAELERTLREAGIRGGVDFYRLLGPMISGPFDVDRMDYIQRDGRNCGVSIGGIEWRRIVRKLMPCLAEHPGQNNEPRDVVLISNIKTQHVLDDFIFSLFQMYAQVYMHPKIVAIEETIRGVLQKHARHSAEVPVDFEQHKAFTDEKFRDYLKTEFGAKEIEAILLRRPGYNLRVASYPPESGMAGELKKNGFSLVDTQDRPMMKDSVGVFLFHSYSSDEGSEAKSYFIKPWAEVSPIARQFNSISYSPEIWVRGGE